ncbi:MAG: HAMP domain-containing histidine kinase [Acidobacteria bacterium]|nr:HAMP domain-containing histidine kinase [Acidobacteriota bacterium]
MTVAAGYARMLLKGQAGELSDNQRRLVSEIERSCARLSGLVAELSDLVKLDEGAITLRRVEISLFSLVAQVAASVHEGADRGVRLEVRRPSEDAVVVGDPDRLRTTLAALLTAVLREKADSTLVVANCTIQDVVGHGRVASVVIADASELQSLSEIRPPVWDVFEQWRGGLGMSLPIADRIVTAHGGRLWSPTGDRARSAAALTIPIPEP